MEKGSNIKGICGKKTNQIIVADRQLQLKQLLLDGCGRIEMRNYAIKNFGITANTFNKYMTQINNDFREYTQKHGELIILEHIEKYDYIYRRNIKKGNDIVALKALDQKEKLLKIHEDKNIHNYLVNVTNNNVTNNFENFLDVEELIKIQNIILKNSE